jgi:ribosomal protein L17
VTKIQEYHNKVTNKILLLRSITRILASEKFSEAYDKAEDDSRKEIEKLITNSEKDAILAWIRNQLNQKTIFELRKEARRRGIKNYNKIPKEVLSMELNDVEKAQEVHTS